MMNLLRIYSPIYNNLSKYPSFSKLILGEMTLCDLIF